MPRHRSTHFRLVMLCDELLYLRGRPSSQAHASMGGGPSKPGTAVTVEVLPGVVGVVSPAKIKTLFGVLDYVTKVGVFVRSTPLILVFGFTKRITGRNQKSVRFCFLIDGDRMAMVL